MEIPGFFSYPFCSKFQLWRPGFEYLTFGIPDKRTNRIRFTAVVLAFLISGIVDKVHNKSTDHLNVGYEYSLVFR